MGNRFCAVAHFVRAVAVDGRWESPGFSLKWGQHLKKSMVCMCIITFTMNIAILIKLGGPFSGTKSISCLVFQDYHLKLLGGHFCILNMVQFCIGKLIWSQILIEFIPMLFPTENIGSKKLSEASHSISVKGVGTSSCQTQEWSKNPGKTVEHRKHVKAKAQSLRTSPVFDSCQSEGFFWPIRFAS